ncbi:tyrosine-type recombinase/integrase [Faecalicatena contorta]|uniref:Site-specific recombinase XerD n=1 Tax=Faecalicatena contorta TaxID=39482 RepID=A0A316AKE4_9FIRM|nr:tyrosine-type recombinase/integrase [Faecalicatena contorta]PWJ50477.1 site-specific recombinase XerD [Faecalicatena contorta]SUQ13885.1 Site-specific recombinase XerD [Faecalicatena contorta]
MQTATKRVDNKGRKLPDGFSQRSDGRYQARFTFNGKRFTLYDTNLINLKTKVLKKKNDFNSGIYGDLENMSLNQWFEKWLQIYKKDKLKPITFQNYQNYWKWYIADTIGSMRVSKIKRVQIISFYNDLLHGENPLASGTVGYINNILYGVLEQAVYNDLIHKNPAENVMKELVKPAPAKREALSPVEQGLFLDYIDGHKFFDRYKPMFTIAFGTGLRVGELTALTWEDIDFENEIIDVNKTLHSTRFITEDGHRYLINSPKTRNAIRIVPMLGVVKQALKQQKAYQESLCVQCNVKVNGHSNFVFTTQNGKPYTADLVNIELGRIMKVQNREEKEAAEQENREPVYLKYFSSHVMRHSFASRCYEAGMDVKAVQKIMGHARIDTTMDIYTHCSDEIAKREMKLLESVQKVK